MNPLKVQKGCGMLVCVIFMRVLVSPKEGYCLAELHIYLW